MRSGPFLGPLMAILACAGVGCSLDVQGLGATDDASAGSVTGSSQTVAHASGSATSALDASRPSTDDASAVQPDAATWHGDGTIPDASPADAADGAIAVDAADANDGRSPSDASSESGTCAALDATACAPIPNGWTLVASAVGGAPTCPAGFSAGIPLVVHEAPDGTAACTCGSCTTSVSCESGAIDYTLAWVDPANPYGGVTCADGAGDMLSNDPGGSCGTDVPQSGVPIAGIKFSAPAPAWSCSSPGQFHADSVVFGSDSTICAPDAPGATACDDGTCLPAVPAPFKTCIMAPGTVSCPDGAFSVVHHVGTGATGTCDDCGCTVSATCSGTVDLYPSPMCAGVSVPVAADGVCHPLPAHMTYGSYEYVAGPPADVQCNIAQAPAAAGLTLTGAETLCCIP